MRANRARLGLGDRRRIGRRSSRCCLQLGRLTHPGRIQRGAALLLDAMDMAEMKKVGKEVS